MHLIDVCGNSFTIKFISYIYWGEYIFFLIGFLFILLIMRCNVTVSANAFIVPACLIRVITATNRNIALSRSEIFFFYIKDFLYIRVLFLTYFFVLCVSGKRHNIVLIKFFFCKKNRRWVLFWLWFRPRFASCPSSSSKMKVSVSPSSSSYPFSENLRLTRPLCCCVKTCSYEYPSGRHFVHVHHHLVQLLAD